MIRRLLCRLGLICRIEVVPFERGLDVHVCERCGNYDIKKRCK